LYELDNGNFYAAFCLRKIDQSLQVGDYVEIIKNGIVSKIIDGVTFCGDIVLSCKLENGDYYAPCCLRKLTDSEIAERLNQKPDVLDSMRPMSVVYEYQPNDIENGKILVKCTCGKTCEIAVESGIPAKCAPRSCNDDSLQVSEIDKVHAKLNWLQDQIDAQRTRSGMIGKQLDEVTKIAKEINQDADAHRESHVKWRDRISEIEKRLDFIEKMQRDQTERKWQAGP
jgi:chaperonin cofactor prefoldin